MSNATMAMTEKQERMLRAVQGLLAKTVDNGATVEEASAAAEKAQALAFKYGLDLAKAAARTEEPSVIEINDRKFAYTPFDRWVRDLMWAIASANGCKVVYHTGQVDKKAIVTVVGPVHALAVCEHMHEYLKRELTRLARASYKATYGSTPKSERPSDTTYINRFAAGGVVTLRERLMDLNGKMRRESAETNALVSLVDTAVEAKYREMFPQLGKARGMKFGGTGFAAGRKAAEGIALNAAMTAGATRSKAAGLLG